MARQHEMFEKPSKPKVWRAHVVDAGVSPYDDGPLIAQYGCNRCGWKSGWMKTDTVSEAKRGIPCECCNQPK